MNKELNYSYNILYRVYIKNSYLGVELNNALFGVEDGVNKGLITKISYGVVERDIALDYIINQFVNREPSPEIALILKIGVYAGIFLNSIPKYTIVNELVELSKRFDKNASGFVNATLKNILNGKITFPDKEKDYINYLSVKYSYPKWILNTLFKYFEKDKVFKILSTKITELTHIRVNTTEITVDNFKQELLKNDIKYQNSVLDFTLYVDYEKLITHKNLSKYYIVQGLPSIITALNAVADRTTTVLDVCSAPGGKSVLIAMLNNKYKVTSLDIHKHRLDLVENYAKKYGVHNVTCKLNDATKLNEEFIDKFSSVLVDVPCSGSGVIVKKPDILINRKEENVKELVSIQKQILETSAKYVKPGGILTYSTCSILPCENQEIIAEFLKNHNEFSVVPVNTYGVNVVADDYGVTFFPYVSNTEGFYIGRLVRNAN